MISPTSTRIVPHNRMEAPMSVHTRFRISAQPVPIKGVRPDGVPTPRGMARIIRHQAY
ncbi:MAG TPA: hypothetical protein VIN59_02535 [Alphaproteobacteria bacterium]